MRRWRIIEVMDHVQDTDLTDDELVGVSIILGHYSGEPRDDKNVYWRARQKIQPQVQVALVSDE